MRSVTFTLQERVTLVPVEVCMMSKPLAVVSLAAVLLSGIGPEIFSAKAAVSRGGQFILATLLAVLAGSVVTPFALPWLPGRQFWLKGLLTSILTALLLIPAFVEGNGQETLALGFWIMAAGSYLAMNFTGSTPYTSLSGVETEMRRGLKIQIPLAVAAIGLWLVAPFLA